MLSEEVKQNEKRRTCRAGVYVENLRYSGSTCGDEMKANQSQGSTPGPVPELPETTYDSQVVVVLIVGDDPGHLPVP